MGYYAAALGTIGSLFGGALAGKAASKRRREIGKIAETPGVDIGDVTAENLAAIQGNIPAAGTAGRDLTLSDQETLEAMLERSMPGYQGRQVAQGDIIDSMLAGEIPEDVARAIERRDAARAVEGGFAGSRFGGNLTTRDLGLTGLDLQQRGLQAAGQFAQVSRGVGMAPIVGAAQFAGITPSQAVSLRSNERSEKLKILLDKAMSPTSTEIWGKTMSNLGESWMGMAGTDMFKK